jgi:hypothetical protein
MNRPNGAIETRERTSTNAVSVTSKDRFNKSTSDLIPALANMNAYCRHAKLSVSSGKARM